MKVISNLKKAIQYYPLLYRYKSRKSLWQIFRELVGLTFFMKKLPSHYFTRRLFRKEVTNIKDYLPNKFLYNVSLDMNDLPAAELLRNKLFFNFYYGQFLSNLPEVVMYNHGHVFIIGKERFELNTPEEFEALLKDVILSKSKHKSLFIKKTYESYGGKNIVRISEEDFPLPAEKQRELYSNITSTGFLFQEPIIQHAELNRINATSVNSIRMDTFIDKDKNIELISGYLRMSIDGAIVDNISSGGCFVGVDIETGELQNNGYSSITVAGGNIFTAHPVTGTTFKGFKIPFFEEAKKLVLEAASLVPGLRLIGWDIAITEKGPVLIEGNCGYDITLNDLVDGGYRSNPVFMKVLKEINFR